MTTAIGQPPIVQRLRESFARAVRACPQQYREAWYLFAGRRVRVRTVGTVLARRYDLPFAHLATGARAGTHLTIDLVDAQEAGVACPEDPEERGDPDVPTVAGGRLAFFQGGRIARHRLPGFAGWLDREAQHLIGWHASGEQLALFERTRPLPVLLPLWYLDRGIHIVHAGLVARHTRGLLLAGPGGAGKSTAALACLCAGFAFLGDDHIGLQRCASGAFVGHSLFSSTRLAPAQMALFPLLAPHAIPSTTPEEPKSLVFLARALPERLIGSAPVCAIILPKIVDAASCRIRPASRGEALRALAPSTLLQMAPRLGPEGLQRLARLTEQVPSYWLDMGRDLADIPRRLDDVLHVERP